MQTWHVFLLIGASGWLAVKWYLDKRSRENTSKVFRDLINKQLKEYDDKVAQEKGTLKPMKDEYDKKYYDFKRYLGDDTDDGGKPAG
jgi:hypothetical protein